MKDFFISYNKADRHWAEWIAWHLEESGYTTVIQAWDFRPGSNFALDMHRAATECERTVAVLSPDYLTSGYTQPEWAAAFAQDPDGRRKTLLPVRVRECDLKGLLPQVVWLELVGADETSARDLLLAGISPERQKPVIKPAFPGAASADTKPAPPFPGNTPANPVAPRERAPSPGAALGESVFRLCDRDSQRDDFDEFLHDNQNARALVCGVPGQQQELPLSLVERFSETTIRDYARKRWGKHSGAISHGMIEWPIPGDLATRSRRLLKGICDHLRCDERASSATAFVRVVSSRLEKVIVLSHDLYLEQWDKGDRELAQWYLEFWGDVHALNPAPQFLVFLNLLYPEKQVPSWRSFLSSSPRFNRDAFEKDVRAMFARNPAGCPKVALTPLGCVEKHHVKRWFDHHRILDEGERIAVCDTLFKNKSALSMKDVQPFLKKYHKEYVEQR